MRVELQDGDWYEIESSGEHDDDGNEMLGACVLDGHRGQYIYGAIVNLAVQHGFRLSVQAERAMRAACRESIVTEPAATEAVVELSEKAEEYLNEQVAPDGWSFGWSDGEYFFANDVWFSYEG